MNRIVTALSISALLGAAAVGSLQAGGPPEGGYDTQSRSESRAAPDTTQPRAAGAAPTVERANEPAAGSITRERSAAPMDSMSGTEAQARARDAEGRPDRLFGYPVSYTFPFADGEDVQPERIGGVRNPSEAGHTVAEITGDGVSVAVLDESKSEDSSE